MKKAILLIIVFVAASVINESQAVPPRWWREIWGCTWVQQGTTKIEVLENGQCRATATYSGSSWLWGDCGITTTSVINNCQAILDWVPTPPSGPSCTMIAGQMSSLRAIGYTDIDPDWEDPEYLENNPTELQSAVEYRLELAGYTYNANWELLIDEPCPVPTPDLTVQVAQSSVFVNPCPLVIYPNPSSGNFTIDLSSIYNNVTKIEVVKNSNSTVVYSKLSGFTESESFDITGEVPGYYTVIVYTLSGTITETIEKTLSSTE